MFSISKLVADAEGHVIALDWSFETEDGRVGNRWELLLPYGPTALEEVTEAIALGWLEAQLPNSAEELSAYLRSKAEREAAEAGYSDYTVGAAAPVRVTAPVED